MNVANINLIHYLEAISAKKKHKWLKKKVIVLKILKVWLL